jgi:hypothetical protein
MRVLELLITCSSNPCIFSWLVFLFFCDFGAEEVICDDSGEEGDVLGVDGLSRSSFLSVALAGIAFLTLARVLFYMSISSNHLQSCFLSVPDISFALLSFLYSFKMALYFFLQESHVRLNPLIPATIRACNLIHVFIPMVILRNHQENVKKMLQGHQISS